MKLTFLVLLTAVCSFARQKPWRQILAERLPYFGDGNWIVVTDSAFPLRAQPAVETVLSDESPVNTVRQVLDLLSKDAHVQPLIHTDLELKYIADQDAPGIDSYRQLLAGLLEKFFPEPASRPLQHTSLMRSLDEAATRAFNVLIIKTSMALPYTSVFFELKTGYWSDDAEQRLRQSIP